MIVEMNKASFVPVAVEMKKGFPASDAWLLLERVKSFRSPQQHNEPYRSPQQHDEPYLNCIDLSP